MKIIQQFHEILSYNDISKLEVAGRTCYQSQDRISGIEKERIEKERIEKIKGSVYQEEQTPSLQFQKTDVALFDNQYPSWKKSFLLKEIAAHRFS